MISNRDRAIEDTDKEREPREDDEALEITTLLEQNGD